MTSPGEGVTVFTSLYLSAGAPALGEVKGLIDEIDKNRRECGIDEEKGLNSNQIYQNKKIKNNINDMKNSFLEILLIL